MITLYPSQRSVVEELKQEDYPSKLLALPTNFGKTLTILTMLAEDKEELTPALVIAPKRVSETSWTADLEKIGGLSAQLFDARTTKRSAMEVDSTADVVFTSVHNFQQAKKAVDKGHFKTLIIDEVDLMKSTTSKRWKTARAMRPHFKRCFGMTGTAVPSDLTTLWGMCYLIDQGDTFGKYRVKDFLHKYFTPGHSLPSGVVVSYDEKEGARQTLLDMLVSMSIVRKTDSTQEVTYEVERWEIPMTEEQKNLYQRAMKESIQLVKSPGDTLEEVEEKLLESTSAKVSVMKQLSTGFHMVDGDKNTAVWVNRAKLDVLKYTLLDDPCLIFFQYKAERDAVLKTLEEAGKTFVTVDDKDAVERWNRREVDCFVSHPASISHGMNLQWGGSRVVWVSLPATYSIFHQGNMRLSRKGQTEEVTVHVLTFSCTLETARQKHYRLQKTGNDWLLNQ